MSNPTSLSLWRLLVCNGCMGKVLKPPFYICSDSHWFHKNIVKYAHRPENHEHLMLERWKQTVGPDHKILHLGDLFFGGRDGYDRFKEEITPNLTGDCYLILGNHDKRKYDYEALGFTVLAPFVYKYRGFEVSFSHYPKVLDEARRERRLHVHGHIHNNEYSPGEATRWGNINVSMEMIDYRPQRVTRLLNRAILDRNKKERFNNGRQRRWRHQNNLRHKAA